MTLRIDRVLADRPFAEVGTPQVAVVDERRGLLAVAGAVRHRRSAPVAVHRTSDLTCVAMLRSEFSVHALAFHPELPLLAVGTGQYDGGCYNKGELLLLDLESGLAVSAFHDRVGRSTGRTVQELEWLDGQSLRLCLLPAMELWEWPDEEPQLVDLHRPDWRAVTPRSVRPAELQNCRPRPPVAHRRADPEVVLDRYSPGRELRSIVHDVELLADGRLLASLDGVLLECRLPSGELSWSVPVIPCGGMQLVVAPDQRSAWVHAGPWSSGTPDSVSRIDLSNGTRTARVRLSAAAGLHVGPDGLPVLVPRRDLQVRHGSGMLTTTAHTTEDPDRESERWVGATVPVPLPGAEEPFVPGAPPVGELGALFEPVWAPPRPLFPLALAPREIHDGGPGVELPGGDLLQSGARWRPMEGHRPGDCYLARRGPTDGATRWVFRTDRPAVVLDTDDTTAYAGYANGDLLALSLADGTLREWTRLTVRGAPLVPTALTVTAPGRLLVGTECGRLLHCTLA